MKKYILILFLILDVILIPTVFAQESTSSASIQDKLKALQSEIASRAAAMKNEVTKKLLNKAYIGTIKNKDAQSLTVDMRANAGKINISEFTEYIVKSISYDGDAGLKKLNISDPIAALGDVDDKGVLTAKRVLKLNKPVAFKKVIHGIVTGIAKDSATVKTVYGDQFTINFDKNTDYKIGNSDGGFDDIKVNRWIIAVVSEVIPAPTPTPDKQSTASATPQATTLLADFTYIFPSSVSIKPKASTPSATPKPTKATKP